MFKNIVILFSIFIFGLIGIGFTLAKMAPDPGEICTLMGCPCAGVEGERPCNSCSYGERVFMSGVLNIERRCSAQEMLLCESGEQTDRWIDRENADCETIWRWFGRGPR